MTSGLSVLLLAAVFGCAPLVLVARTLVSGAARARHHEVGSAVFLQLGAIYAVLLAFIFNEVYGEYVVAEQSINKECAALHATAMLGDTLPEPARTGVENAITQYVRAVIHQEWPAMTENHASRTAMDAEQRMFRTVASLSGADPSVSSLRSTMLDELAQAHASRETRLFEMTLDVPPLIWVLLLCFSAVLVTLLLMANVERFWPQTVLTATFVGAVAFLLVVIRLLDSPFTGPLGLQPTDFHRTLERVTSLQPPA
ncbi:DUF4239 domain-containing protein [Rhizosaccharibacter radicis]|uniref:DUF4239 domain-containing protein n=1 Tax=Rhizosaccharibacter radicis TaxID=2782605 RepID=A0ABT1VUJ0_9PROT|nr:DUF4239 domain-containing protein [Acetobacteraceae bacterium KSS12]